MSEWQLKLIKDLGEVITGKTPSKNHPEDWGDEYCFITPSDYGQYNKYALLSIRSLSNIGMNRQKKKLLPSHSVLVTCIGSDMGKVVINKKPSITNQQINALIPNNNITDYNFLYYLLKNSEVLLKTLGGDGTAVPILNKTDFENIELSVPDLPEQKAIANVLSALDDKIDLLQRQNETLEKMAETLFRQWFIEEAKEDWELCSFEKWVSGTKGGDWGKEVPIDDFTKAVYCLRGTDIANLQKNMSVNSPLRFIKEKKFYSIEPDNGDIVIEISGGTETQSTGRSYYINEGVRKLFTQPIIFSNFCRLITVKNREYSYFIYLYLKFLYDTDEFFALENGSSGIKNLNYKAVLFEQKFLMPTVEKVIDFHKLVCSQFIRIDENRIQIQTLQNLRDTLLPKLMSGEVRVKLD